MIHWTRATIIALFCTCAAAHADTPPVYYIYLADPEVFLPQPVEAGEQKKSLIDRLNEQHDWPFRLIGLYPLDNEIPNFKPDRDTGLRIYQANIALMDKAHVVAANMVRFRGPSMDVGTAFEMGYMRGLGKPVFAYYDAKPFYGKHGAPGRYPDRVAEHYEVDPANTHADIDGLMIEDFDMPDNLMMMGALDDADTDIQPSFQDAILQIAEYLMARSPSAGNADHR